MFVTALALQISSVVRNNVIKNRIIQGISIVLLIVLAEIYRQNGFFMAGMILFLSGIVQLLHILPLAQRFRQVDLLNFTLSLIGFAVGIYLAISNVDEIVVNPVIPLSILTIIFLVTTFLGASAAVIPNFKYNKLFLYLQILPWMMGYLVFMPSLFSANFIAPTSIILMVLLKDFFPWNRLQLPEDDILGHRVVLVAGTIELTLLIFLSAILFIIDPSFDAPSPSIVSAREAAFIFFAIVCVVNLYTVITILMTINGLVVELTGTAEGADVDAVEDDYVTLWGARMARYIKPFMLSREGARIRINAQADQIQLLSRQIANEKKRNTQLILLMELSQQLENHLDQPVAAQLTVNTLERALPCSLASIYVHEPERKEFMLLAAAGRQTNLIPPGYRQSVAKGIIGRAFRQRKTQIVDDIRLDSEYIHFENEDNLTAVVIPLIFNGHVNGAIVLNSENANAFSSIDIGLAETMASELTRAWERSGYHRRLMNLIQAGSQLSSVVDPTATAQDVAVIARDILDARVTFVHIQLGQERNFIQSASSGNAPRLFASLENPVKLENLMQMAFHATQPFRVRDVRKYATTSNLSLDDAGLRSMLTIPIRWHQVNIGAIFAFGKQNEVFFTENDESLAELLAIQSAGAFESTWLQQELRASLRITSLLYRLSNQIIQAENLEVAAADIAQTAHKLARGTTTGIVLFDLNGGIIANGRIDADGESAENGHPMTLIKDAMDSGQLIYISQGQSIIRTCLPIQTPIRKYGAIWMDTPDEPGHKPGTNPNDLQALVNQAAIALERSLLLVESRRQAVEIKEAYDMLEATYDQTLASLISALDARDRETEGHSMRVSRLAIKLGETLGYSQEQLKVLERGSILHDIGKIGISDSILHKPGPLTTQEWTIMKEHPDIGARIVDGIPFLQNTIPIIRHHQERWNGTGYPDGLSGTAIPELARLFAVVDAFDALTSNRPYRQKISTKEALHYLHDQAGILFDPEIVRAFQKLADSDQMDALCPDT